MLFISTCGGVIAGTRARARAAVWKTGPVEVRLLLLLFGVCITPGEGERELLRLRPATCVAEAVATGAALSLQGESDRDALLLVRYNDCCWVAEPLLSGRGRSGGLVVN